MTRLSAAAKLCLLLCVTSCASTQPVVTTQVEYLTPPPSLTTAVPEPECNPLVWGDLLTCWVETMDSLRLANVRLQALRTWAAETQ